MLCPSASVYGACADAGTESAACGIVAGKYARNGRSLRASVSMGGPPPGAEHAGPIARGLEYLRDGRGGVGKRLLTGGLDGRIAPNGVRPVCWPVMSTLRNGAQTADPQVPVPEVVGHDQNDVGWRRVGARRIGAVAAA